MGINAKGASNIRRNEIDKLIDFVKALEGEGICWFKVERNALISPIAKFFKEDEIFKIKEAFSAEDSDLLLISSDKEKVVYDVLSSLRLKFGKPKRASLAFYG